MEKLTQSCNGSYNKQDVMKVVKNSGREFTSLNRLASYICDTPVSMFNLLDQNFQFTASKFGDWDGNATETQKTICQFTVQKDDILVINDTLNDERTKSIKEITGNSGLRFYAGVPINAPRGERLGTFCVIGNRPQELSQKQQQALIDLGQEVESRITLFYQKELVESQNNELQQSVAFLENSTDIRWVLEPATLKILEVEGAEQILGCSDADLIGKNLLDLIDQVNIQNHIKQWTSDQTNRNKLGVPVQLTTSNTEDLWLDLTFTRYNDKVLATGRDITKQHRAEEQLKDSLEEKEILLAEIHHRVKNNLAIISGLLMLESMNWDKDTVVHKVLTQSKLRVHSMAKIHEKLYESRSFTDIELGNYITELTEAIVQTMDIGEEAVALNIACDEVTLDINQALPCALIINELVTNAFKYAFDVDRPGELEVTFRNQGGIITLVVRDNGPGLPEELEEMTKKSLGHQLVRQLVNQLDGDIAVASGEPNGTRYEITFEKTEKSG